MPNYYIIVLQIYDFDAKIQVHKKATTTSLLQNFKSFSAYNFAALTQQIGKSFAFI